MVARGTPAADARVCRDSRVRLLWPSSCRTVSKLPGSASNATFAPRCRNWCGESCKPARRRRTVLINRETAH